MPIVAADLTYPTGEIRPEWFAGENLAANLGIWIVQGYAAATDGGISEEASADAVARAFGYWRAYDAKALSLAATPNSVDIAGEIGVSGFTGQAKFFREKANEWKMVYDALIAAGGVVEPEPQPVQQPRQSVGVPNVFRW